MGEQLDFSKLLVWKLLLSISSLDDNYYDDWDRTFGKDRENSSYLNHSSYDTNILDEQKNEDLLEHKQMLLQESDQLKSDIKLKRLEYDNKASTIHNNNEQTQEYKNEIAILKANIRKLKQKDLLMSEMTNGYCGIKKQTGGVDASTKPTQKIKLDIKSAPSKIKTSKHINGQQFQKKQEVSNNLIYLENAIDDITLGQIDFSSDNYIRDKDKNSFLSLENKLKSKNDKLVTILNTLYDTLDPLTLTYLNKLIATSIPLIDRLKLYIFIASLMPELSEAFVGFLVTMKEDDKLSDQYNEELNKNLNGMFYKNREKVIQKRAEAKERPNMMESMLPFGKQNTNGKTNGKTKTKTKSNGKTKTKVK